MKRIAVFDFDGTLTMRDSMLEFIKYSKGPVMLLFGLLLFCPLFVLMKFGLYPNWKAKQHFFSFFFKGCPYKIFQELGKSFESRLDKLVNVKALKNVGEHISQGDKIYVITASIEEWVRPWCISHGIANVLGTKIEVEEGVLTGKFLSNNCYGMEKVKRLLEVEPDRQAYDLFAYGDGKGDKEMIEFADRGEYVK